MPLHFYDQIKKQHMINPFLELDKKIEKNNILLNKLIDLVQSKNTTATKIEPEEVFLTTAEVMAKYKIKSATTLWSWEKKGKLQPERMGKNRLFPESKIKQLLNVK